MESTTDGDSQTIEKLAEDLVRTIELWHHHFLGCRSELCVMTSAASAGEGLIAQILKQSADLAAKLRKEVK